MQGFVKRGCAALFVSSTVLLSACGGGGSSSNDPVNPSKSFALAAPVKQTHSGVLQKSGAITGTATYQGQTLTLSGTMSLSSTAATIPTQFNGQPALQGGLNMIGSLTINGQTTPFSSTSNYYETSAGIPLGTSSSGDYCVVSNYAAPPANASIGSSGQVMNLTCYTDSSKQVATGTQVESYTLSAGPTADTALLSVTDTEFNTANQQVSLTQIDFLIDANGNATLQQVKSSGVLDGVSVAFTLK